jgi:SAM-dependent methyltransferase
MQRIIQPEILDGLPADDPRAVQSRRDLQKVNTFMRHPGIVTRALRGAPAPPRLVVELGAGDGTLLLRVARRLGHRAPVRAVLVDRRPSLSDATRDGFAAAGWEVDTCESDVFEWLCRPHAETADVTVANLFLHHFHEGELATLLTLAAQQTRWFIACEPRRSRTGLVGVSLLRLIGCNDVTIHDAGISVRAGFLDRELSTLWPTDGEWQLTERRRGPFTHTFIATLDQTSTPSAPPVRESRASG